jgi:hypothetical protein
VARAGSIYLGSLGEKFKITITTPQPQKKKKKKKQKQFNSHALIAFPINNQKDDKKIQKEKVWLCMLPSMLS